MIFKYISNKTRPKELYYKRTICGIVDFYTYEGTVELPSHPNASHTTENVYQFWRKTWYGRWYKVEGTMLQTSYQLNRCYWEA